MVVRVVTSDGDSLLPFIFPRGLKINMEPYTRLVEEVETDSDQGG